MRVNPAVAARVAIAVAAIAALPWIVPSFVVFDLIYVGAYTIAILGLIVLTGMNGQISLGHALYFGIGAYTATLLYTKLGIVPWFGMVAGGLIAAALFRLAGHYFTIATIVIAEAGLVLANNWDFAGAATGIQWPYGPDSWATLQFARTKLPYIYFGLGFVAVTWLVTFFIENSRWGYWWRAVKDNADAAESLGVMIFRSKMAASALSAFFTAVGGAFYAAFVSYIDPESTLNFSFSLLMALPAVLGGIGTLWGPAILIPLTEVTRSYLGGSGRGFDLIVYGLLVMVIALARPEGLVSLFLKRAARAPHA